MIDDPRVWQLPDGSLMTVTTDNVGGYWIYRPDGDGIECAGVRPDDARPLVALPAAEARIDEDGDVATVITDDPGLSFVYLSSISTAERLRTRIEGEKRMLARSLSALPIFEAMEAQAMAEADEDAAEWRKDVGLDGVEATAVVTPESLEAHADWLESRRANGAVGPIQLRVEAKRLRAEKESEAACRKVLEDLKPGVYNMASMVVHDIQPDTVAVVLPDGRFLVRQHDDGSLYDLTNDYKDERNVYRFTLLAEGDLNPVKPDGAA